MVLTRFSWLRSVGMILAYCVFCNFKYGAGVSSYGWFVVRYLMIWVCYAVSYEDGACVQGHSQGV